jgi:hypothetical protein
MVDSKSKGDTTATRGSSEATNLYDTVEQNCIRIVDEFIKAQPQYTQSASNLQLDYIAASKNTIQNMVSTQKVLASNVNFPIVAPQYIGDFVKRSNEITENIVSAIRINNQLAVNVINAVAENVRTLNRSTESMTEFNTTAAKAWNSFVTAQQQKFLQKQ